MNRYFKILATAVAAAGLLASCNREDVTPEQPDQPVTPEVPSGPYRLTFEGGAGIETATRASWADPNGSGNLIFQWDYTAEGQDGNEMVMAFYKEKFIASTTGNYHTYASIHRHGDPEKQQDNHYASFTTVEKYDSPLSSGDYEDCRVVALTPLRADNDTYIYSLDNRVIANLPMPGTFEQNDDQEPDFLSNYMYMYADASIIDGAAFLLFEHIPATFRFKITNKRPEPARINSVKVTVVDTEGVEQPVASQFVDVLAASDEDIELSYSTISYTEVTTNINASLATDEKYTAYALVLPLFGNAPLEGKKIRFTIDASNPDNEYLSFELDAETLANANHGEYNWVGGKSYTINMRLGDVLYFDGVTVKDWTQEEIEGGEAEEDEEAEWPNGINIYTGEYAPAEQNAEGEYEVANAGNLMWMSQQINARTLSIPYTIKLVDDITIGENLEWMPIAHPDGTQNSSVFDGNGHTLTINQNRPTATDAGFGIFQSFNYSTVKDLTIKGDIVLNTTGHIGAIASTIYRTTISRVISYANITNLSGSGRVGGLVGQFGGQHSGGKYSLIENCAVYANVSGDIAGGIIGYGWAGWQYYDIKNSAFYGDVTGTTHQGAIIGYHANNQTATQCTFKHIYYYEKDALGFSGGGNTNYTLGADVIAKTPAEFASVTMAELLNADQENDPWEYVTGNDYPTLKK